QHSDDAILSKTLDGIITSFNPAAERLYGYAAQEVIGRDISILVPPDHQQELRNIMERLRRGERIEHFETVRRRSDGSTFEASASVSPVRTADGRLIGVASIVRDITESLRMARELAEHRDELERLVAERTAALRVSLEKLRRT